MRGVTDGRSEHERAVPAHEQDFQMEMPPSAERIQRRDAMRSMQEAFRIWVLEGELDWPRPRSALVVTELDQDG